MWTFSLKNKNMKLKPLYKRSTTDKISYWEIEVEGNKFRTISGFMDGKKVTSDWTVCKKKSYNTAEQQALKQAKSLHKKKKDLGAFENIKDVDKPTPFSPMLAKEWTKYKAKVQYPIGSDPKLDGMRCVVKADGMWSRTGKPVVSSPHIFESLKPIFDLHPNLVIDGELYADKLADNFDEIMGYVKHTKPTPEDLIECEKHIEFHVYDYDDELKYPLSERKVRLKDFYRLEDYKYVKIVPTYVLNNEIEVDSKLLEYVELGYEGQILRVLNSLYENKRTKNLLKHKQWITDEFIIVDVLEGEGKLANKAGTFQVKTKKGVITDVSINGTHDYLADLWIRKTELIGKEVTVRYWDETKDGSLRFAKVIQIDRWSYE